MRTPEEIKERIRMALVEQISFTNSIAQVEPENYIPRFIDVMTEKMHEILLDEILMRRRF